MGGGGGDWGWSQVTLGPSLKPNWDSRCGLCWPRGGDSRPLGQYKPDPAVKPVGWGCRGCPKHGPGSCRAPPVGTGHALTSRLHTRDVQPPYTVTASTEPTLPGSNGDTAGADRKPCPPLPGPSPGATFPEDAGPRPYDTTPPPGGTRA